MINFLQIKFCPITIFAQQIILGKDCYGTKFYLQIIYHFLEVFFFFGGGSFVTVIFVILAILSLTDEP